MSFAAIRNVVKAGRGSRRRLAFDCLSRHANDGLWFPVLNLAAGDIVSLASWAGSRGALPRYGL
jgi:hypothetical protein